MAAAPRRAPAPAADERREPSKFEKAKEYAAKVPKPKPRPAPPRAAAPADADGAAPDGPDSGAGEDDPLAALEQRHLDQKERAQQIRAQMGL
eukprot:CAMPEP_0206036532 /NCGR_PEP_ID=MMETSP1466-20131121/2836_1 /ASSEMBLY_ACC=CAM_ASM_001126 /TAXON_ID=44452 /ORGANISM="Pavlova gyrans, Strain CCMP608" /LENGTH=91 /DNA_ID=CAMNT_0053411013 /DNA_START=76 /DNA_END=351 /DNA_ORIENTATION=+